MSIMKNVICVEIYLTCSNKFTLKKKTERRMTFHIEYTKRMQVVLTKIYSHNFLNNTGTIMHII